MSLDRITSHIRAVRPLAVLLAICCCLSAVSAQWPGTISAPPDLRPVSSGAAISTGPPAPSTQSGITIGVVDTVGGTTYDHQVNGPPWRMLANSASRGIYVVWMYTADTTIYFPDRNMRFNYYDRALQKWVHSDSTDFMSRGVNVFPRRASYGSIDVDTGGTPYISSHAVFGGAARPWVAKGVSGNYSDTTLTACAYPPIAVGRNGAVHVLPYTSQVCSLRYCRIAPDSWPHWSAPLTGIPPNPWSFSQNIAASKVSDRVSLVWELNAIPGAAYQMQSTDGGRTWDNPAELAPPEAYGGDTLTGFGIMSLFPFYDRHDRFHIVANLLPVVRDTARVVPSQIWHYCPDNSPEWSRIHVAGCDPANMKGSLSIVSTYACRPSIGEDRTGGLYVAWEQFDSANVETTTSRLRADIFFAQDSGNNGASWHPSVRLTDQGSWSCRFPSAIDYFGDDTFRVSYVIDQQAGYFAGNGLPSEGVATRNPVVVHKVSVAAGIGESRERTAIGRELSVWPNPFKNNVRISYELRAVGNVSLQVCDVAGRTVRTLASGFQKPGTFSVSWDARDTEGKQVPYGVYLCRLETPGFRSVQKAVVTR